MITDSGKMHIRRFLAGQVGVIAESIAIGIGSAAATATDKDLQFEVERIPVDSVTINNGKIVFMGTFTSQAGMTIKEVGLWSAMSNAQSANANSRMLALFNENDEPWVNGTAATWLTTGSLIGNDSLRHQPAASATSVSTMSDIQLDLSEYSPRDNFVLAFNNVNNNLANVQVRFYTDATNYFTLTFTPSAAGYQFAVLNKGSAVATGAPVWASITSMEIRSTSKAAGASDARFDALRAMDSDSENDNYQLVSRNVLTTALVAAQGRPNNIEVAISQSFV